MCTTCPFRPGSKYAYLKKCISKSAASEALRICHSTGSNNAINRETGLPEHLCRGAKDFQNDLMFQLEIIKAPTDEAWNNARIALGMKPLVVHNPQPTNEQNNDDEALIYQPTSDDLRE
jgi:hypothetical protein